MSLEILSNKQIVDDYRHRWPRFCLDPRFWDFSKVTNVNPIKNWKCVKFDKASMSHLIGLDGKQGIYMFVAKPNDPWHLDHCYIMYVGETKNLKQRFGQYFGYANTKHPSDQKKRKMVLVWEGYLWFYYIETNFSTKAEREELEYDLIDSIVPPINDDFRSEVLSGYKKILEF